MILNPVPARAWPPPAILVVALVTLTVAACAQPRPPGGGGPGGPQDPTSGVVSSSPLPPGPASPGPSTVGPSSTGLPSPNVVATEDAVDLRRHRWSSGAPVPGAPEVLVQGTLTGGPPCAVLGRVQVDETPTAVTITLWVGRRAQAQCDGPQPELGYPFVTRVRLAAPLGARELRDGAA